MHYKVDGCVWYLLVYQKEHMEEEIETLPPALSHCALLLLNSFFPHCNAKYGWAGRKLLKGTKCV